MEVLIGHISAQEIYNRIRGLQPWPGAFRLFAEETARFGAVQFQRLGQPAYQLALREGHAHPEKFYKPTATLWSPAAMGQPCFLNSYSWKDANAVTALEFANGAHLSPGDRFGV